MGCSGVPNCTVTLIANTVAPHNNAENFWQWFPDQDRPTTNSGMELPEEGVYLFCQNRALQIAARSCAVRKCQSTKVCSCGHHDDESPQLDNHKNNNLSEQHKEGRKHCIECLYSWLNIHVIQQFVDRFAMTLIAHPKPLHLTHIIGKPLMEYDFEDDAYLSGTIDTTPSTHMSLMLETWNNFLFPLTYHNSQALLSLPQSPSSLQNNIASDSDINTMDIDDGFLIVENEATEAEEDGFDFFNDIIDEQLRHHRAFSDNLDDENNNNTFIFGLDGLGKIDGPDMTELPEDDRDMVPVADPGHMDITRLHPTFVSDFTRSPVQISARIQSHGVSVSIKGRSLNHIEGTPCDARDLADSEYSEDSDDDMAENEILRYHHCTRKPCALNCQDPDSRNPWRCIDDHPKYQRQGRN